MVRSQRGQLLHHHLTQFIYLNCQIKTLFGLFFCVTRECNINDEAMFVNKGDFRAIEIQFLVSSVIVKSQSILKFSLFSTFLGICLYHFTLPSNLCCLHNNVPDTLSCLCLYYFRANFGLSDVYEIFEV